MKIPRQVTIGQTPHQIRTKDKVMVGNTLCRGCFDEDAYAITLAKGNPDGGYKYSSDERANTFWHELTHAILYDMNNKLTHDEKFVSDFADRLHQAISTAEF